LERATNNQADPDAGASASGTADVAMQDQVKFFENADKHFSATSLEALKKCVVISANVTDAEKKGLPVKLNAEDLKTAEMGLRGISVAINKIAAENPDVAGVENFAKDMKSISSHYSALAAKLLPTLSTAPQADKNS